MSLKTEPPICIDQNGNSDCRADDRVKNVATFRYTLGLNFIKIGFPNKTRF
jgi:hypothetical protein